MQRISIINQTKIVKTDFDFGWQKGINPIIAELSLKYNHGDILDIGCGTCQLIKRMSLLGRSR